MTKPTASRVAWTLWAVYTSGAILLLVLGPASYATDFASGLAQAGAFLGIMTVGALVASRRPENPIGWLFCALPLMILLVGVASSVGENGVIGHAHPSTTAVYAVWLSQWLWFPTLSIQATFPFLLFPSGTLPTARWRPVAWAAIGVALIGSIGFAFPPGDFDPPVSVPNPLGIAGAGTILDLLQAVAVAAFSLLTALSLTSLVLRYRRADPEGREQIKWLIYPAALLVVFGLLGSVVHWSDNVSNLVFAAVTSLIPVGAGIAILKYRLYDIDVVINKTLVYGSLAGFITAVYVGIVVGIGSLIGQGSSEPNLGLSILATAVVAVAFQPVRERVQMLANRLVYGKRATPYEVLSEFSHRMAGTVASDDVLPRMARILAEGTGAKEARVWLGPSGRLTSAASWPELSSNGSSPEQADLLVPVIHQGEELGALSIAKAPGDRLTPSEEHLVNDLASQAGLVLRNVKLISDLKASRVRLVQAQDAERRRIERNIHDGAQQQLVALQVKLGLAKMLASRDPDKVDALLGDLQEETNQALQDLRDLARGIYPPLLQDQGLVAALQAQARRAPLPVTIEAHEISRHPSETEAAIYFCVLEALQNVAKYAKATMAAVTLTVSDDRLEFTVTDDGVGFETQATSYGTGLQGMADRLAAQGGEIEVRSRPGEGTTIAGRLGALEREPVG